MSLHKLTAGSGYDYLTRQVAAQDVTERGHGGLASYYTERGEVPGVWVGAGVAGIEGLAVGDAVSEAQMQALFGSGHHPLAHERMAALQGPDLAEADYRAVTRLDRPFKVYAGDVSPFRVEVARRVAAWNTARGLPEGEPVDVQVRARIRTEVGVEFFRAEHGRDPAGPRELAAVIAKGSRPRTSAVAGFDLTFSPVKSVSALWALAHPDVAARVERAHQGAVRQALAWIEGHALFTRTGTDGVRQVEVTGLVAAAFTHRDSRAGDPDLHTHVAVANKVQTLPDPESRAPGRWLSIDGRVLYAAAVTASEVYNTTLEQRLTADLGVTFTDRTPAGAHPPQQRWSTPGPGRERDTADPLDIGRVGGKRPVREITGIPVVLLQRWSARRAAITDRHGELASQFQGEHGRPPTAVESVRLAQQATLETRAAKHAPRTLAEQRTGWAAQAAHVLGGPGAVTAMLDAVLHHHSPTVHPGPGPGPAVSTRTTSRAGSTVRPGGS